MRKSKIRVFWLGLWVCAHLSTSASAQVLDEVVVRAERRDPRWNAFGDSLKKLDSKSLLSDVLGVHSALWVRSTAPGLYASPGLRGLPAAQTTVLWEGLPIQSPALGVADLSTLPPSFFQTVSLYSPGSTAAFSGQNAGGLIALSEGEQSLLGSRYSAGFEMGSFGALGFEAAADIGNAKHEHRIRVSSQQSDNDYAYQDPLGRGELERENADWERRALMYSYRFRSLSGKKWNYRAWVQEQESGIPDQSLAARSSGQRQQDFWIRQQLGFDSEVYAFKLGWFYETGTYRNPLLMEQGNSGGTDFNQAHTLLLDGRIRLFARPWGTLQTQVQALDAQAVGFNKEGRLSNGNARIVYQNTSKTLSFFTQAGLEVANGIYPSGSIRMVKPHWFGMWTLQLTRSFRAPTANDLYWNPGGNASLLPEQGWVSELAWETPGFSIDQWRFQFQNNLWARTISNLIRWLPGEAGIWSPENTDRSRGIGGECFGSLTKRWGAIRFAANGSYQLQISENSSGADPWEQAPGQPVHRYALSATLGYKSSEILARGQWSSEWQHYAVQSNDLATLEPLSLVGLEFRQGVALKKFELGFWFRLENVLDQAYAYIPYQPMPGLNYRAGLKISFHHPKPSIHEDCIPKHSVDELIELIDSPARL